MSFTRTAFVKLHSGDVELSKVNEYRDKITGTVKFEDRVMWNEGMVYTVEKNDEEYLAKLIEINDMRDARTKLTFRYR